MVSHDEHPNPTLTTTSASPAGQAERLQRRGIAEQATAAEWHPYTYGGRPGWVWSVSYPGGTARRWKAADSQKPKNKWLPTKPDDCKYYIPQTVDRLIAAVANADGVLWIANGEPSLLAHLAAGIQNVVCWFGETQPPHTLADDARQWGTRTVCYPADKDDAGLKGALAVRKLLKASGIDFRPLQWGDELPEHGDANDAWIAVEFDAWSFSDLLHGLGALLLPADELPPASTAFRHSEGTLKHDEAIAEVVRIVEARPGRYGRTRRNGDYLNFCCPLHDEHEPSAGINLKTGAFTCFVCDSFKLAEVCEKLGIDYAPRSARLELPAPSVRIAKRDQDRPQPADNAKPSVQLVKPLTLWQNAAFMYMDDPYPLIAHYMLPTGCQGFSATEYAALAGVTFKTAKKRIDVALARGSVSRLDFLQSRGEGEDTTCKKYKRELHGAAVGERYCLTPERALPMIRADLWKAVLETLERGYPDTIFKTEAGEAFPDMGEAFAGALQAVTSAAASSIEADEIMADDERFAMRIADEILRRMEYDETPLTVDIDPANMTDIRRRAIESLVATDPTANWLQGSEMSWVAGSKRSAMPALIRTSRLTPSASPTFTPVMLPGKHLYHEALVAAKKNRGALASWIDAHGKVIRGFSSSEPPEAAGVLINQGKTYSRHERMEPMPAEPVEPAAAVEPLTPEQEAEEAAQKAQKRARAGMVLRLRGCMRARGWRFIPGAFGYWERHEKGKPPQYADNTCEGMANALVADYAWALNALITEVVA